MRKLYFNGTIITMESRNNPEAVLVKADQIEKVGSYKDLKAFAPDAQSIDLNNHTMLPAFIDAHSHFSSYANAQRQVQLDNVKSFDEIKARITSFMKTNAIKKGEWVVACGYDHTVLKEKSHPSLAFLDAIAPHNPLFLQHQSGHCGVVNSVALKDLCIDDTTPNPEGGLIGKTNEQCNGYLEENAFIQNIKKVPMADLDTMLNAYRTAQQKYLSYGITTIQEGMMVDQMLGLYQCLLASNLLQVDLVAYPDFKSMPAIQKAFPQAIKKYHQHFKIGGYKIILDGSPQVKTAWMKTPYRNSEDCGYGVMSDQEVEAAIKQANKEKMQLLAHCNGDRAAQQYIDAIKKVSQDHPEVSGLRCVIIHAQLLDRNQLGDVEAYHLIPSFFIAHIKHWGHVHIQNFGRKRAYDISPAKSTSLHQIPFTFHQDAPVIEPNMLETLECAITRKNKDGEVMGEDECLDAYEALKAITIHGAYQYFEEAHKGSIKEGKQADFVILDDNPLTIKPEKIHQIKILETIKDGVSLYQNTQPT
ncbi:MAG: amidohydrolase [Erysipelotrichaceae bacterium]